MSAAFLLQIGGLLWADMDRETKQGLSLSS